MPFSVRYSSSASVVESGFTVEVVEVASPTASFFVPVRRADGALAWGPVVVSCVRMRVQARPRFTPALVEFFFSSRRFWSLVFCSAGVGVCAHVCMYRAHANAQKGGGRLGEEGVDQKNPSQIGPWLNVVFLSTTVCWAFACVLAVNCSIGGSIEDLD